MVSGGLLYRHAWQHGAPPSSRLPMKFRVWEPFLSPAYYQTNRARTEQEREKHGGRGDEQRLFEPRLCFVSFRPSILYLPHFAAVHRHSSA